MNHEIMKLLFSLFGELKNIKDQLQQLNKSRLDAFRENWIDGQDVMQIMHISPRTLATYRDKGLLPFSRIRGKIYYKMSAVESLLDATYSKSNNKRHETN